MNGSTRTRVPQAVIMAGGTGGHVFPALAVAGNLHELGVEVLWMGTRSGLEQGVASRAGFAFREIRIGGLRGKGLRSWLVAPWMLSLAFWQVMRTFLQRRPQLVLGMGGFVAGPGGVVAFLLGVPLVIHEQNAIAGVTNRLLAPLGDRVLTGFPDTFCKRGADDKVLHVGNPVRDDIAGIRAHPGADAEHLRLIVLGGSLGASIFNRIVPQALALIEKSRRPRVRQQTGRGKLDEAAAHAAACAVDIDLFEFEDDMAGLYRWGNLILCRAGAMTIAEITATGLAAILVPYPYAVDDHQAANARFLVERGAAVMLEQEWFSAEVLADLLTGFSDRPDTLRGIAEKAGALAMPDAGRRIADICMTHISCRNDAA